jgi:hypothetical protein
LKGFTRGPVIVAIVWVVSVAIVLAALTMKPAQVERHFNHLWLFPLR